MTNLEVLYREIAASLNLPVNQVESICRYQFRFVRETTEGDTFKSVRLPYLGLFKPMQDRLVRYKESKHWDKEAQKTIRQ